MSVIAPPTYSTGDLIGLAGLTLRRANHWHDLGLLVPVVEASGSGSQRRYDERELRIARVLRVLADLGCPLQTTAMQVAVWLRSTGVPDEPFMFVSADGEVLAPWDWERGEDWPSSGWVVNLDELAAAS